MSLIDVARRWREENGYCGRRRVIVLFERNVQSWVDALRNPEHWQPGCITIDETGQSWTAIAGKVRMMAHSCGCPTTLSRKRPLMRNVGSSMVSFYITAKWRTARLTRFNFRTVIAIGIALGLISLGLDHLPLAGSARAVTQRNLAGTFLFLASAILAPMLWSSLHLGQRRAGLQLFVENRHELSFHWTPRPEWLVALGRCLNRNSAPSAHRIPRREALTQLAAWIVPAHAHGFRQVCLESPLFVRLDAEGLPVRRDSLKQFAEAFEQMQEVDR
jgi:hypothetical protein